MLCLQQSSSPTFQLLLPFVGLLSLYPTIAFPSLSPAYVEDLVALTAFDFQAVSFSQPLAVRL
jgi:hypothetical protein